MSAIDDLAAARAAKLPVIRIVAGELSRMVRDARTALIASRSEVYQHGNRLVRIMWDKIKTTAGEANVLRLSPVAAPYLLMLLGEVAQWQRWDKAAKTPAGKKGAWVPANVPREVVEGYVALDGGWGLPRLLGVTTVPTMRPDGTILDERGYDTASGLYFDPVGVAFPKIPEKPKREDALKALDMLKNPMREFKFVTNADKSVALSGIITPIIRPALPVAPMHAFSAPVAGSGKSKLVDMISVIATGELAAVTAAGSAKEELEKRLVASMLAGDRVIAIDNVEGGLSGEFLCQCLTQARLKPRVLGHSRNIEVPNVASLYATGNNLTLIGDLTRRVLRSDINPESERPELAQFDFCPVAEARKDRPALVVAALTIVRAWVVEHGKEKRVVAALGSFEEWSHLVRQALIWLGQADPVEVLDKVRENDPRIENLTAVLIAWRDRVGLGWTTVNDLTALAKTQSDGTTCASPAMRDALMLIAPAGREINASKLGWWLRKHTQRRLTLDDGNTYWIARQEPDERGHSGVGWGLQGVGKDGKALTMPEF